MNKTELLMDKDLLAVVEFMHRNVPTCKLVLLSDALPEIGRLLWSCHPQEPVRLMRLEITDLTGVQPPDASVSDSDMKRVGDGSVVAKAYLE